MKIRKTRDGQNAFKSGVYLLGKFAHAEMSHALRFHALMEDRLDCDGWNLFDEVETIGDGKTIRVYGTKL